MKLTVEVEVVPLPQPLDLHCQEWHRSNYHPPTRMRCCSRPRLLLNGVPVCDGHAARVLRRMVEVEQRRDSCIGEGI